MPFDWFTVVAQSINFIVLLWLLKRFLYKPILNGLDAREKRLQNVLHDAKSKHSQAQALQQEYENKHQAIEQQRASILKATQDEADEMSKTLVKSAQKAADDMLRKRLGAIQHELHTLQQQVLHRNVDEIYATAGKLLHDLAGVDLQQIMVNKFLDRMKSQTEEQNATLVSALQRSNNSITIRSAYALSDKEQNKISQVLTTLLGKKAPSDLKLSFILVPQLVAGIELSISGWKMAWSINQHLQTLQQSVIDLLQLAPLQTTISPNLEVAQSAPTNPKASVEE